MDHDSETQTSTTEHVVDQSRPWETLIELSRSGDVIALKGFLDQLTTGQQILALSRLDLHQRSVILRLLPADESAELLGMLPEIQAVRSIADLDAESAAEIVREMSSDLQADVIGDLQPDRASAILQEMSVEEADAVRGLAAYDDDVAGGLMVSELLKFTSDMTVGEVTQHLIENSEEYDDFDVQYGYVCDVESRLIGVLPMRNLLFAKRATILADIMIPNPIAVSDLTPLDQLANFFDSHNFLGVPVVDSDGRLRGVVHRDDVAHEETRARSQATT